jgi:hypothetical protein
MAWANSKVFRAWISDQLSGTITVGKMNNTDVYKAALFGATPTPDNTVTAALSAYTAGQWIVGSEITDANWPAGGQTVAGTGSGGGFTSATNLITFDGTDTAGSGNVTVAGVNGDLLYDFTLATPVAKQGCAYHYFGGAQQVTAGTFCVDAETEILTGRGWLRHDQVRPGDTCLTLDSGTGLPEWQPVLAVHVFADGPHDVIRLTGPSHSSVTTPDHRWPAATPGADRITWHTTRTLPPDAQLLITESERTDKAADLAVTTATARLVWCVQTPNRTWYARRDGTRYFTGNTIIWNVNGLMQITC